MHKDVAIDINIDNRMNIDKLFCIMSDAIKWKNLLIKIAMKPCDGGDGNAFIQFNKFEKNK